MDVTCLMGILLDFVNLGKIPKNNPLINKVILRPPYPHFGKEGSYHRVPLHLDPQFNVVQGHGIGGSARTDYLNPILEDKYPYLGWDLIIAMSDRVYHRLPQDLQRQLILKFFFKPFDLNLRFEIELQNIAGVFNLLC